VRTYSEVFGKGRVLLGVIHLGPLPGSPRFQGDLEAVVEAAVGEARIIAKSGFDGIVVENYGDLPFMGEKVGPETVAAMSVATREVKDAVGVPVGVNVLRNDAEAALAIAGACGCEFVRVNVLVGAFVTSEGLIEGRPGEVARLRMGLAPDSLIFADTLVKHAYPIAPRSLADDALDVAERGGADAVIITGPRTGKPPSADDLEVVRASLDGAALEVPILVGSGADPSNARDFLRLSDGLIVGSYIRRDGKAGKPIEPRRVLEMGKIKRSFAESRTRGRIKTGRK
jgi:membrane complex biogenesis BtpA family protein